MSEAAKIDHYQQAFETLCDRRLVQSMYSECDVLMERVLLTLHGQEHTLRRALELKLFRRDFTRYYEKEVYPQTLAATLAPYLRQGSMDLHEFGVRVNLNLASDIAGIDRDIDSAAERACLLEIVRKFGEGATLFHSTRNKDDVRQEVAEALALFDSRFFQPSMRRREQLLADIDAGNLAAEQAPRDILTVLLQSRNAQDLDEAMIRREVAFFMQAATHSSANAMVHAFHHIHTWCLSHPKDALRLTTDPLFLQRCVHESLRLHPASPVAWRTAACPFALVNGISVAEGAAVVVDLQTANQDPNAFGGAPEMFDPHRVTEARIPPYGLTFGVGVHTCFGRDLAGGTLPQADTDPDNHHYGTLTSLLRNLFEHNVRPDPDRAPTVDADTQRKNWRHYPVLLDAKETL